MVLGVETEKLMDEVLQERGRPPTSQGRRILMVSTENVTTTPMNAVMNQADCNEVETENCSREEYLNRGPGDHVKVCLVERDRLQ